MFDLQPIENEFKIEGFNSVYYFEFGKNFTHTPEKHDFWEMVYVDNGEVITVVDGVGTKQKQGQVVFHAPMEPHAHISDMENTNNMLIISFVCKSPAMEFFRKKMFTIDKTSKTLLSLFTDEVKNVMGKIPDDYENKNPIDFKGAEFGSTQLLSCYFTEFLIKLFRNGNTMGNKIFSSDKSRLMAQNSLSELIAQYMSENLHKNLSLKDICDNFMLGKSQICSIFKNNIGKSPMDYYNELKIQEAKRLLRSDLYSVSQISDLLGYSCIHSFSRTFKRTTGFSPTAYTKSIL